MNTDTKNPSWWNEKHTSAWDKTKDAFHRDWEQTKADFSKNKGQELKQNAADTMKQGAGKEVIPPDHVANSKPMHDAKMHDATMHDAKMHDDYETAEPALRYGYGASSQFADHKSWDDKLETKLSTDWDNLKTGKMWNDVKSHVKSGFERARKQS